MYPQLNLGIYGSDSPAEYSGLSADDEIVVQSVQHHSLEYVIKTFLQDAKSVPECKVVSKCLDKECTQWKWID